MHNVYVRIATYIASGPLTITGYNASGIPAEHVTSYTVEEAVDPGENV